MPKADLKIVLDPATLERVRDAVVALDGAATISGLVEQAILRELVRLERRHGRFPRRRSPVRTGRPKG